MKTALMTRVGIKILSRVVLSDMLMFIKPHDFYGAPPII
jgi:hypothetical protein